MLGSKIFVKKTPYNSTDKVDYIPHQWLSDAIKDQKEKKFMLNPVRPSVFELDGSILVDLAKCKPDRFLHGDIVWTCFTMSFSFFSDKWGPDIIPIDLVRVGCLPAHLVSADDRHSKSKMFDESFGKLRPGATITLLDSAY